MKSKQVCHSRISLAVLVIFTAAALLLFSACKKERVVNKMQVILISIDTLRADHLSAYGYNRDTSPNITGLIKDSVHYTQAYPNGCWTMPSHMSLLTGTLPSRHGITQPWGTVYKKKYWRLNDSIKTIADVLEAHKSTIKTLKYAKLPTELGFANGFEKNIQMDPFDNKNKLAALLKEIEDNKEKDFFFFLHTWKVHAPYTSTYFLEKGKLSEEKLYYLQHPRKLAQADVKLTKNKKILQFLKENNLYNAKDCMTLYDGGIHNVDGSIGKLIEKCKQLGIYDDVMIIIVSDHGEHFAEHFPNSFYNEHGYDYYEEFIKVPLIIKYPAGTVKPGPVDHPVTLVDVFPTLLDFYKIQAPAYIQGNSLLAPTASRQKYIVSEAVSLARQERKLIRVGDLKYIITMENPSMGDRVNWEAVSDRKLFDLKNDPLERKNLYADLKFRGLCINFEKMLIKTIKDSTGANRSFKETAVDQETLNQMKALGYLD
ncbi:MAG: Sulfatase-like hydrolase/transferase [Acidobacteriota bacterium]|nr:Sulfatase-like hydrolase/transferase [Acidobacteriota bacterium]